MKTLIILTLLIANMSLAETFENKITKTVEEVIKNKKFNGAIIVSHNENIIYSNTIGYADQYRNIPLNDKHLFSSGSVGKEFTTFALLKLKQQGLVLFSEPVSNYLKDLPAWASEVTIEHLLSHTSGLPKIKWLENMTTEQVISQILKIEKLQFSPGSTYLYGNLNVVLRALIIEKITKLTFSDYLNNTLLTPLGMKDTIQITNLSELDNRIVFGDHPTSINGVTIYTTTSDLLKWEQGLLSGRLLSGIPITSFLKQHPLSNKLHHANLDFGRFYTEDNRVTVLEHDGSNPSHHIVKHTNLKKNITYIGISSDGNKSTLRHLRSEIVKIFKEYSITL
ncbi:MAG: beta-lactamase family protein [Colwellia sp.]|nr:beta-lactamase family protein [Colwellia sp.]